MNHQGVSAALADTPYVRNKNSFSNTGLQVKCLRCAICCNAGCKPGGKSQAASKTVSATKPVNPAHKEIYRLKHRVLAGNAPVNMAGLKAVALRQPKCRQIPLICQWTRRQKCVLTIGYLCRFPYPLQSIRQETIKPLCDDG